MDGDSFDTTPKTNSDKEAPQQNPETSAQPSEPKPGYNVFTLPPLTRKKVESDTENSIVRTVFETAPEEKPERARFDISHDLQAPQLPNVKTDAITYEQVYTGITVHIPGSSLMQKGDTLVFYWGINRSSTPLFHAVHTGGTVRVLCVCYQFIACAQYGLVDIYFEVYRNEQLIGTSPALMAQVERCPPRPPRPAPGTSNILQFPGKK